MLLMGTRLPPYGQNAKRAKAWGRACMRDSERSASHRSRRSVPRSWQKSLLPPAREDTFRVRTSVAAACACLLFPANGTDRTADAPAAAYARVHRTATSASAFAREASRSCLHAWFSWPPDTT